MPTPAPTKCVQCERPVSASARFYQLTPFTPGDPFIVEEAKYLCSLICLFNWADEQTG